MVQAFNITLDGKLELVPVQIENGRVVRDQEEVAAIDEMVSAFKEFDAITLAGMACCAMQ